MSLLNSCVCLSPQVDYICARNQDWANEGKTKVGIFVFSGHVDVLIRQRVGEGIQQPPGKN